MKKFTAQQVIDAIHATNGIIADTAQSLGVPRKTVYRYIHRYVTVKQALHEARERTIDIAEGKLIELIQEGNLGAIMFYLKTQGRSRGYGTQIDINVNVKLLQDTIQALEAIGEEPDAVFRRLIETARQRQNDSQN